MQIDPAQHKCSPEDFIPWRGAWGEYGVGGKGRDQSEPLDREGTETGVVSLSSLGGSPL